MHQIRDLLDGEVLEELGHVLRVELVERRLERLGVGLQGLEIGSEERGEAHGRPIVAEGRRMTTARPRLPPLG